jgi:hypothetical protein
MYSTYCCESNKYSCQLNKMKTHIYYALAVCFVLLGTSCSEEIIIKNPVDKAHEQIWSRFIDKNGILYDYTDLGGGVLLPTPDECKDGKPNALGWWSPIENGAMYSGLYMDGMIARWNSTGDIEDANKIRRLAKGLILLSSISSVEGFVGRGVTTDGKSHYLMGSNDQTGGWFYGLWRYLETNLPSDDERRLIQDQLVKTANVILKLNWKIPAEDPFKTRGSFLYLDYNCARLLFVAKIMFLITKSETWNKVYLDAYSKKVGSPATTRRDIILSGMSYDSKNANIWVESVSICCLRSLWELETDPTIKDVYKQGLELSATSALNSLTRTSNFSTNDTDVYDINWRMMNQFWKVQLTETEASDLAKIQLIDFSQKCQRWSKEAFGVREPIFAAFIISLAPDKILLKQRSPELLKVLRHYEFNKLYTVWFFPVESIWFRVHQL